jgi:hypothetical protein
MNDVFIAALLLLALILTMVISSAALAYATNESSYKYGFQQAKSEFLNCQYFDADCTAAPDDCHSSITTYAKNETSGYYDIKTEHYDIMTNKTACINGYNEGWRDSCEHNGTACAFLFDQGFLPDASVVRNINGTIVVCDPSRILFSNTDTTVKNGIVFQNSTTKPLTWHADARAAGSANLSKQH